MDSIRLEAATVTIEIELQSPSGAACIVSVVADGVLLNQYRGQVTLVGLRFLQVLLGRWECYRFVREKRRETTIACQPSYKKFLRTRQTKGGGAVINWYGRDFVLTPEERELWKQQLKSWLKELFARFGETTLN